MEFKLEAKTDLHKSEVQKYIVATENFKGRCVGLSYEKDIMDGMLRLIGSFPMDEWFEEKYLELKEGEE